MVEAATAVNWGLDWSLLTELGVGAAIVAVVFAMLKRFDSIVENLDRRHLEERRTSEDRFLTALGEQRQALQTELQRMVTTLSDINVFQAALAAAWQAAVGKDIDIGTLTRIAQEAADRARIRTSR